MLWDTPGRQEHTMLWDTTGTHADWRLCNAGHTP